MPEVVTKQRGRRKERKGVVVSRSGTRSVVVQVEQRRRHPVYGKVVRYTSRLHAHDEKDELRVGDKVRIVETRPISRMKRWRVIEVLEAAHAGTA